MNISDDIKSFIRASALQNPEVEVCGLIAFNEKYGAYPIECKNESANPQDYFLVSEKQIKDLNLQDKLIAFYHSHPKNTSISRYDKFVAERKNLPCLMYNISLDSFEVYEPSGLALPLVGRPNICGIFDCWDLVVDYYKNNLNIQLTQFDPDYHFLMWNQELSFEKKINLCAQDLLNMNFQRVDYIKPSDIVIIKLLPNQNSPIHFGILLENNNILHAPSNESKIEKYNESLRSRTKMIFRHKLMT